MATVSTNIRPLAICLLMAVASACSAPDGPPTVGTGPDAGEQTTDAGVKLDPGSIDNPEDPDETTILIRTVSTRSDWAPDEIVNTGSTLRWTVSGAGLETKSVNADSPTFDLSQSEGTATVEIVSSDEFAGVESMQFDSTGIATVTGIGALRNATTVALRDNPIESIDVGGLASIDNLTLRTGKLGEIDLTNLSTLRLLWIYDNELRELDVSANPNLEFVNATGNNLDSAALDALVVSLNEHGNTDGELLIADNPGRLGEGVQEAYRSLVNKGWTIDVPAPVRGERTVEEWKTYLDTAWEGDRSDAFELARSSGDQQQYYFLFYDLEGLVHGWMATGDLKFLDAAMDLVETTIDQAVPMAGRNAGYMGWPSDEARYDATRAAEGTSLWEIYLYRMVGTLLRVMHQSPNLRAMGNYQARYDAIFEFTRRNIWEKWVQADPVGLSNIHRSRTHIASHWARLGMELYLITGEQEYKDVFDAVSFAGMPRWSGESLRSRLYDNPAEPGAYSLYQEWENPRVQDTSHGADVISFWATAIENQMYWGQPPHTDDAARLVAMVNQVVWGSDAPLEHTANWDGTGGLSAHDAGFHGSLTVGRFDPDFQNRIERHYTPASAPYSDTQAMGIGAYNRKILDDGRPVYPEHYIPLDG